MGENSSPVRLGALCCTEGWVRASLFLAQSWKSSCPQSLSPAAHGLLYAARVTFRSTGGEIPGTHNNEEEFTLAPR